MNGYKHTITIKKLNFKIMCCILLGYKIRTEKIAITKILYENNMYTYMKQKTHTCYSGILCNG